MVCLRQEIIGFTPTTGITCMTYSGLHPYTTRVFYSKDIMAIEKQEESSPRGLACIRTDDTVYVVKDHFIALENSSMQRFDSKDAECLSNNN